MSCDDARALLPAYMDSELDAAGGMSIEQHLGSCVDCSGLREQTTELRGVLRSADLYRQPSATFAARVNAAVRDAAQPRRFKYWEWTIAAAAIFGILGLLLLLQNRASRDPIAREVVSSHVRSLQSDHLLDVPTSDQHTVKPWFKGKLDFAPPVPNLAEGEWPLLGGRLDYIDHRNVAALIYQRRKHDINVFIWPVRESSSSGISRQSFDGYQLIHWNAGQLSHWVVSDLNGEELLKFANAFRERE